MSALFILSLGILTSFAFSIAVLSLGFPVRSPPPSRASIEISLTILVKTFPLFVSVLAFLCLICAHLECPDTLPLRKDYFAYITLCYDNSTGNVLSSFTAVFFDL